MSRGTPTKTPERLATAQRLRAEGWLLREIAAELGVHIQTVHAWLDDPDGSKAKARKASYRGECVDCAGPTDGSDGPGLASERCLGCRRRRDSRLARERILTAIREWADEHGGIPPAAPDWNPGLAERMGMDERARVFREAEGRWPNVKNAQALFGSWNAAIAAAGFEPRPPGHYGRDGEDPAVVAETVRLYRSGLSLAEVGAVMGCHRQSVRKRLVQAGEPRRPRNGQSVPA